MKKIFLFFAAALFCSFCYADQAVTINPSANATQGNFPVFGSNADSQGQKMQAIYLANQLQGIAVGSEIKALTFYSAYPNQSWGKAEFTVSLAKTDFTYFQNVSDAYATVSEGSTLTEVYEGKLSVVDGELTINFTTPYTYEGGNLLIQVVISRGGSYSASSFYSANTDYLIKYATNSNSRVNKQPKVTFVLAGGSTDPISTTCAAPTSVTVEKVTESTATVSWQGDASQYQYCLEFEGDLPDWTAATLTNQKSVTVSGLYDEQKYYLYVRSYCSETAVSESVRVSFKTACARLNVPWIETFTRDASGSEAAGNVAPECWVVSSANPTVTIVSEKKDDGSGNQIPTGQQNLYVLGGGSKPQIFALPLFNAKLDTCELAFDYKCQASGEDYASLEIGYMSNPADASTFVSLNTFAQVIDIQHVVFPLSDVPAGIENIAFRFAGGTSINASVSMDNFILAGIGKSQDVDPSQEELPDANLLGLSYCQAQFAWYSYSAEAFAIGLFDEAGTLIARIPVTTSECDRFAHEDMNNGEFSGFSDGDDSNNHYYCSTKWILNAEVMQKGSAWEASVINVGSQLGLKPGTYHVEVNAMNTSTYEIGEELANIPFTLVEKKVENLTAVVAEDKTTATLSWTAPEFDAGERLYVRVWSGETVAYDNFETKDRPASPLTVEVVEGKSYTAIVQVVDRYNNAMGQEVMTNFTVGTNSYEPANLNAEVSGGDNVTFSWTATTTADKYVITLYLNGEFYTTLTVTGTSKTTTMPMDGTWSWTVQAFNQGSNGNYFEASNAIAGNDFESKAADIPDDAIRLDVWQIEAAYMDAASGYDAGGKHAWYISLATGEEGGQGLPSPIFMIYTDKEFAISGVYNSYRENIDLTECGMDMTGKQADAIEAQEAELRLTFDGYDDDKAAQGAYRYGYYTGQFRIVGKNGKTYVGKFMEVFCNSFNFSSYGAAYRDHKGMWDEDPDYIAPEQGIENIVIPTDKTEKILHEGQLYIVRPDGAIYNATGVRVK
ncbi:MAG: fibronectin type III domain-containing protein [Paludibacteraceae bacterium]|nr:fibronectin type III domain-containing protein [Paludibacteraceae bacterium]